MPRKGEFALSFLELGCSSSPALNIGAPDSRAFGVPDLYQQCPLPPQPPWFSGLWTQIKLYHKISWSSSRLTVGRLGFHYCLRRHIYIYLENPNTVISDLFSYMLLPVYSASATSNSSLFSRDKCSRSDTTPGPLH